MSKYKNRAEVASDVSNEGLGYFITSYQSAAAMPDPELKAAFEEAEAALKKFEKLLKQPDPIPDETSSHS